MGTSQSISSLLSQHKKSILILTILILGYLYVTNLWIALDTLPPSWDQSHHMTCCIKYYNAIKNLSFVNDLKHFMSLSDYYPPFYHFSTIPFIALFGQNNDIFIYVNFLFLIILVFSTYGISHHFFNKQVGIIASFLVLFFPMVFAMSREYLMDFALTAMVSMTLFMCLNALKNNSTKSFVLLGMVMGFTLLTKWTSVLFILLPWGYLLAHTIRKRSFLSSLIIPAFMMLLIAFPWYSTVLERLISHIAYSFHEGAVFEKDPSSFIESLTWYLGVTKDAILSPNLTLFFFFSIVSFCLWIRRYTILPFFILWIVPAFVILSLIPNKEGRALLPFTPAFAILIAAGIDSVPKKAVKFSLITMLGVVGLIQFNNLSFNLPPHLIQEKNYYFNHRPIAEDWKIPEMLESIHQEFADTEIVIGYLPDLYYANANTFLFYCYRQAYPYRVVAAAYREPLAKSDLDNFDVLVIKTGDLAVSWTAEHKDQFLIEFQNRGAEYFGFEKFSEFLLPDASSIYLYRNINKIRRNRAL